MASFVITAAFEVGSGRVPLGKDVVARWWGPGHQFSYCDGRLLTLVVEITAADANQAFEAVLSRAEVAWEALAGTPLPPPSTLHLRVVLPPEEMVVAGAVGRGPDRLFAEAAAGRAARLRAAIAALTDLQKRGRRQRHPDPDPGGAGIEPELPLPFPSGGDDHVLR